MFCFNMMIKPNTNTFKMHYRCLKPMFWFKLIQKSVKETQIYHLNAYFKKNTFRFDTICFNCNKLSTSYENEFKLDSQVQFEQNSVVFALKMGVKMFKKQMV